jgi:hypothetical protein
MRGEGTDIVMKAIFEGRLQVAVFEGRLKVSFVGGQNQLIELEAAVKAMREGRMQVTQQRPAGKGIGKDS